jgi:hypothetical protein
MDLVQEYLKRVQSVGDVYVLRYDPEKPITEEDAARFIERWNELNVGPIIMIPRHMELDHDKTFNFTLAMLLVQGGYKVGRYSEEFYLYLDPERDIVMEQITVGDYEPNPYVIDSEDMTATDWYLVRD